MADGDDNLKGKVTKVLTATYETASRSLTHALAFTLFVTGIYSLSGCVNLKKSYPDVNHYSFAVERSSNLNIVANEITFKIQTFQAAPF